MLKSYYADEFIFEFFKMPKNLFTEKALRGLSASAKVLYTVMLNRSSLSKKNGWEDSDGKVFIRFTVKDVMETLSCSKPTAIKTLDELERSELIEREKTGKGLADKIFVMVFF